MAFGELHLKRVDFGGNCMKSSKYYYVIYGNNAVGIFESYSRSLTSKKYVGSCNCKKLSSWHEAVQFAINCADEAGYKFELNIHEEDFSINWVLYFKDYVINM